MRAHGRNQVSVKPMSKAVYPFTGHQQFLQVHFALLDQVMPVLSPAGWKVLCFIMRKTKGHQKEEDAIPFSQIKKGTGIKSNHTIHRALEELQGFSLCPDTGQYLRNPKLWPLIEITKKGRERDEWVERNVYSLSLSVKITAKK